LARLQGQYDGFETKIGSRKYSNVLLNDDVLEDYAPFLLLKHEQVEWARKRL
jgi:hypothetical protein